MVSLLALTVNTLSAFTSSQKQTNHEHVYDMHNIIDVNNIMNCWDFPAIFSYTIIFSNQFIICWTVHILWYGRELMMLVHLTISTALLHFHFLCEQHVKCRICNLYFTLYMYYHKVTVYLCGPMKVSNYRMRIILHIVKYDSFEPFAKG